MYRIKILLLIILLISISSESPADEANYGSTSPLVYAIAGLIVVDVGISISNAFSLINDKPNKINGYFGLVTGVVSLGLVAVNYAMEEDDDLRNNFALVMGTAGTASLILGVMNIRRSGSTENESLDVSSVSIYPSMTWERDQEHRIDININISF